MKLMKKIYAILMMAVFLISLVPISLAEESDDSGAIGDSEDSVSDIDLTQLVADIRAFVAGTEHDNILACVGDVQNKFWAYDAEFVARSAREFCLAWGNFKDTSDVTSEISEAKSGEDVEAMIVRIRTFIAENPQNDLNSCVKEVINAFPGRSVFVKDTAKHFCLAWMKSTEVQETEDDTADDVASDQGKESKDKQKKDYPGKGKKLVEMAKKEARKAGLSIEEWKVLQDKIKDYVMETPHDSFDTCVGDVENNYWAEDSNAITQLARYYCSLWVKKQDNKAAEDDKQETDKPMLPAYDMKKVIRAVEKNPELVDALSKFTDEQKDLMAKYFSRARYEWCLENVKECRDTMKNLVEEYKPVKSRVIDEEKLSEARRRYIAAKEEYKNQVDEAKQRRQAFLDLKEKGASDEDLLAEAKLYLASKINVVAEHLNKIKERVNAAEGLSDEKAKEILADLDTGLARLEELRAKTEAAATKEEIRAIADELKGFWEHFGLTTKDVAVGIIQDKVMDVIARSGNLEKQLESLLSGAELRNIDVSIVDELVDKFSAKIEQAREAYQESRELMAKASEYRASLAKETATEEQIAAYRDIVAKSNEKLNQAREYIKEAHDLLNEIMTKLREAYKNKIPLEDKADVGAAGDSSEDSTSAASDSERPRRSRFACDDSDGGRDIFAAGSVNGFSGYMKGEFVDYCSDDEDGIGSADEGKYVHEYFCQDGLVVGNTYKCDNGCSKGACVE